MSAEKEPTSTGFKLLIGCAALLGVGALVFGLIVAVSVWWIWSPGPQIDPLTITTPDTVALLHVDDLTQDVAFKAYLDETALYFTDASQGVRADQLPEELRWVTAYQQSNTNAGEGWARVIPRNAAVIIDPTLRGSTGAAVNFPIMVRPMRAMMTLNSEGREPDSKLSKHQGRDVIQLEADSVLAFEGGTALWADSADLLHRLIDAQVDGGELSPLVDDVAALHADWSLVGVTRDAMTLADLTGREEVLAVAARGFERVWFGIRMDDADTLALRVGLDGGPTESEVPGLLILSDWACPALETSLRELGLDPRCGAAQEADGLRLNLTATGLRAATRGAIDAAFTPQTD